MKKSKPESLLWPILIGALALVLRVWNTISVGTDFYGSFLSDASTYRVWAGKLAAGASYGEPVFQMGPLYPYFLAINLGLGFDFYAVLFIQAVMGALVAVMLYYIARSIYGQTAAIISGVLAAIYAPFIFYDGLLLSESLQVFLLTGALFLLLRDVNKPGWVKLLLSGFLIGLTALGRATILFFPLGLFAYWIYGQYRGKHKARVNHWPKIALISGGLALGIMPATLHNIAQGDFVLISSNTGINFYIGNSASSDGTYNEPPGLDLWTDFTGRKAAERESGHVLKSSEVSSFWTGKTLSDIKSHPGDFIFGLAKKTWLYLWHYDISQAESIHIQGLFSFLFRLPLVGFGLLLVLGSIGYLFSYADNRRQILAILLVSNFLGVVLFFVIGRFRLIAALPLLIFAGAGVMVFVRGWKSRDWRKMGTYAAISAVIALILFLPRQISTIEKLASVYDNVGVFHYYRNQLDEAHKWYRMADEVLPNYPASLNNIGTYFYARGLLDSAEFYFKRSVAIDSSEDKIFMNLGRIALDRGDTTLARSYYEKARNVAPFGTSAQEALDNISRGMAGGQSGQSFDVLFNAAEKYAARGDFIQAEKFYREALSLRGDDIKALNNLGFALQAQKKFEGAAEAFAKALRLAPESGIAYNNLAGTIYQMGLADSALVLWEKAVKLDPTSQLIKTNYEFVKKNKK